MDESHWSSVGCSNDVADAARGFCRRQTIWQRLTKIEGDNSCCYKLTSAKAWPILHGQERVCVSIYI